MRKFTFLIVLSFLLTISSVFAQQKEIPQQTLQKIEKYFQEKGEIYFKFQIISKTELNTITNIISIDNVKGNDVFAYSNRKGFDEFIKLGYKFELLQLPSETATGLTMSDNLDQINAWNVYPTYDQYITMMYNFATTYPSLCRIVDGGNTVQGRKILFAVVSKNVNLKEPEPKFMYTSSIHGDEITGYVTMLRLIDTLLSGYMSNPKISYLLDNVEIWINPLANPDGTYHGGNNTVTGAVRYNANNVDMNRNYPDPAAGPHPDGNAWQTETVNFMNIATSNYFMLSMNFHGGAEVFNYPWDTWSRYPADDAWYIQAGKHFVDTIHAIAPTYMDDNLGYPNYPGVVNGYAWYRVTGGRQDFMTYFRYGREITCEISSTKLPAASTLPTYWNNLNKSLMYFIKESLFGVRGIVTDSITGAKLKAKVFISSHDTDSSWVYSDTTTGDYHRFIATGTYSLTFSCPGHYSKTISNVYTKIDSTTILNVQLRSTTSGITGNENNIPEKFELMQNYPNPFNPNTLIEFNIPSKSKVTLKIYDYLGREVATLIDKELEPGKNAVNWNAVNYSSGVYFYKLTSGNNTITKSMILVK